MWTEHRPVSTAVVTIRLGFANMPSQCVAAACNLSENGARFCSSSRKGGDESGRMAGGQRVESCRVQGCYKEVNTCTGSSAIIKYWIVFLAQMVDPLLHFLYNLSLTQFPKNSLQDGTLSIINQWPWCTASFFWFIFSSLCVSEGQMTVRVSGVCQRIHYTHCGLRWRKMISAS